MIVTFKSKATGNLIYFKDIAVKLLSLMGRDDKVPSALYAEDVPGALEKLQLALSAIAEEEQLKAAQSEAGIEQNEVKAKPYISLTVRAQPLVEMLQRAVKKQCPVQWE